MRDLARWGVPTSVYEPLAAAYAPAGAEPLPDLSREGRRLARRQWGAYTFETLPDDRARQFSRWSDWQAAAFYWCDGRRTLAAAERLARAETGRMPEGAMERLAEACVEAGLAAWK